MSIPDPMILAALLLGYNLFVFAVYFSDKEAARAGGWRISERTLLTLALIGGSPGAISAQRLLRHKTRKEPFRSILLAIAVLHATLCGGLLALFVADRLGLA
jgi:uncharacterized membrane protein YsdA (DUF1294 family)